MQIYVLCNIIAKSAGSLCYEIYLAKIGCRNNWHTLELIQRQ